MDHEAPITEDPIRGRKIVLGVTGSIAAFKAAYLTRLLVKAGADVSVVVTKSGLRFVTSHTFAGLTGKPVWTNLFDDSSRAVAPHLECAGDAAMVVVAPATANFIAKMAAGLGDDLLSCVCLAATCPIAVVPAMHHQMWANPLVQANTRRLESHGYTIIGPVEGELAGRDKGPGRMVEPEEILRVVRTVLKDDMESEGLRN